MALPLIWPFAGKAYGLLTTEKGRRACRDGWQIQFWEFVALNDRAPDQAEERVCIDKAAQISEAKCGWPAWAQRAHDARMVRFERVANGS